MSERYYNKKKISDEIRSKRPIIRIPATFWDKIDAVIRKEIRNFIRDSKEKPSKDELNSFVSSNMNMKNCKPRPKSRSLHFIESDGFGKANL